MPQPQPEVIEMLVDHAFRSMAEHQGTFTADEVVSACMTMCLRAVSYALENHGNVEALRAGVAKIYSIFPAERVH